MQTYKHLLSTCEYSFVVYVLIMQGDLLCNILLFVAHSLSSVAHASHLKSPDNIGQTGSVSVEVIMNETCTVLVVEMTSE